MTDEATRRPPTGTAYLLHAVDPATGETRRYEHAGHYLGRSESSGLLTGLWSG
jgi:hypothetical protein